MAAPVPASRTTVTRTSDATTHSIPIDVGNVGDLILIIAAFDGQPTVTVPAGWHKLSQATYSTTVTGAIIWKHATQAAAEAVTLGTSVAEAYSAVIYRIPLGGIPLATPATGTGTQSNPPAYAADSISDDYLWIAAECRDGTPVASSLPTTPGIFTSRTFQGGGISTGAGVCAGEYAATGTTIDPGLFGNASSGTGWVAWTISVPPVLVLTPVDGSIDEFEAAALDTTKWENWGGAQVTQSGGALRITNLFGTSPTNTADDYRGVTSLVPVSIDESWVAVEMAAATAITNVTILPLTVDGEAGATGPKTLYWQISTTGVSAWHYIGNSGQTTPSPWQQQGPTLVQGDQHRWFAIGEVAGNAVFAYSADGQRWRRFVALANPLGRTDVGVELMLGNGGTAPTAATTAQWSRVVKLAPPSTPAAASPRGFFALFD